MFFFLDKKEPKNQTRAKILLIVFTKFRKNRTRSTSRSNRLFFWSKYCQAFFSANFRWP